MKESTDTFIGDTIESQINELVGAEYDAKDLLSQADVWLSTEVRHNYLYVKVDFDRLAETTHYELEDN